MIMAKVKFIAQRHPKSPRADIIAPIDVFRGDIVVEYWRHSNYLGTFLISERTFKKYKSGKPIRLIRSGEHLRHLKW